MPPNTTRTTSSTGRTCRDPSRCSAPASSAWSSARRCTGWVSRRTCSAADRRSVRCRTRRSGRVRRHCSPRSFPVTGAPRPPCAATGTRRSSSGPERGAARDDSSSCSPRPGRRANIDGLGLENTSLELDARGVPVVDPLSMRAGDSSIFIAGDAAVELPLLHEAADEGRLAGENAARFPDAYPPRPAHAARHRVHRPPDRDRRGEPPRPDRAGSPLRHRFGVVRRTGTGARDERAPRPAARLRRAEHRTAARCGDDLPEGGEPGAPARLEHRRQADGHRGRSSDLSTIRFSRKGSAPPCARSITALGFGANPPARCIDCGPGG